MYKDKNRSYKIIFYIFIFTCIFIIVYIKYRNIKSKREKKENVIPLHIYQTWHTRKLPPKMELCVEKLKADNPEFTHHFFDDDDCREFIKQHFDADVLYAFDKLKPGAYKADLWRYCVLYVNGGIYLDIKYECKDGFKLIELTDKEYFVREGPFDGKNGIYNAFMVCKAKNNILLSCIDRIVENVKNRYYGNNQLEITGPQLINQFFTQPQINNFELKFVKDNQDHIEYHNQTILTSYPEYRNEHTEYQLNKHYYELWKNKDIYN